jgi:tetratricopeptide (TPR) repeat protein
MKTTLRSLAAVAAAALTIPFAATTARTAHAADASAVTAAKAALQDAVNHGDAAKILAARASFVALADAEPKNAPLQYWVAVCDWRVTPILQSKDKKRAAEFCKDGVARCDKALQADGKLAEAHALKAGLQGLGIGLELYNPMMVSLGMEGALRKAKELAPTSPRVALLEAMNTLHKPEFVGGGAEKATKLVDAAIALAEKDAPAADPLAADWGKDDVYLWAGRAAVQLDDFARAKALYEKALVANPNNGWVRSALLPQVEKKLAAKAPEKGDS